MTYNPTNDFVGLWRAQTGGVVKGEMPGLDFVVAALARAGIITVVFSTSAPASNQDTTAWFKTATPSYQGEGTLYLWDSGAGAYAIATPSLFADLLSSLGVGGVDPATAIPLIESGAGAVGTSPKYARQDHVHPASAGAVAATAFPLVESGFGAVGTATKYAREDHVHPAAMVVKNYIINGSMMVSQENGTLASSANGYYPVDMFTNNRDASSTGVTSVSQLNTPMTPGGSPNRIRVTVTTADTSIISTDAYWIETKIENIRLGDLYWNGTWYLLNQKTVTLQFGVRAPQGTYSIAILSGGAMYYIGEYTVGPAQGGIDAVMSVVIPPPLLVGSAWNTTPPSATGMTIRWALACGTAYQGATPNAWTAAATNVVGSPNQFNFVGSTANTFDLFDVSLTEGSVALPNKVTDYATELEKCQRYFQMRSNQMVDVVAIPTSISLLTAMRTFPVITAPASPGFTTVVTDPISPQVSQTTRGTSIIKFNARL